MANDIENHIYVQKHVNVQLYMCMYICLWFLYLSGFVYLLIALFTYVFLGEKIRKYPYKRKSEIVTQKKKALFSSNLNYFPLTSSH